MSETPSSDEIPTVSRADSQESRSSSRAKPEFEGYQILEELPQGGQGVVCKAIHKATKMKVALKVLLPGLHASAKARHQFEQEVELAASLNHPNIVAIRDSGISRGQYYFAMEYIHGQPLDKYVASQLPSFREKIVLFSKICDAMTHAHQRGVIHRDLKPSNILVDERGEPHILDFGLAKAAIRVKGTSESTVMPSITGQIKGTVTYMSPEQAVGRPDLIDVRTDVYSLGVMLYRMFMGKFPYDVSGSTLEVLQNIQYTEPIRPRQVISRFDSDVEAILLKALAKDTNRRYQSVAELQHDVQCWLEGLPIVARSVSSIYLLRKIITKHRYTSTVVALLLVIIFGFSCVYYHLYARVRESKAKLQKTLESLNKETENYYALVEQVALTHLLDVWHIGYEVEGETVARYLGPGTRETEAQNFLSDPRPLKDKITAFRQKLEAGEPFFVEFIIAEHYLKDGNRAEAVKAYQACLSNATDSGKDELLIIRAKLKLNELAGEELRGKPPQPAKE